jgi:multifunctional methyltransferase subunit TRM112
MRVLSHNSLKCPAKDVTTGYPLLLEVEELEVVETECNSEFIKSILPTLEWKAVCIAADAIGLKNTPAEFDTQLLADNDFVLAMHNLLMDIHVIKGFLVCPESGRRFPIENRIVNMM